MPRRLARRSTEARFPCEDRSITLAFATSVYTHLMPGAMRRYLEETRRVLAPGGRAVITAFLLDEDVERWMGESKTVLKFPHALDGVKVLDARWPENGVAIDRDKLKTMIAEAGLTLRGMHAGHWRPEASYAVGQDLVVVSRD